MQVLDVRLVIEIYALWYAGCPKAVVARRLCVDRKTVRGYVRVAEAAGARPGGPPVSREEWRHRVRVWFPLVGDAAQRHPSWREIDRHRDLVAELLRTMPVAAAHRVLRERYGLAASLASFRRYVRAHPPA